MKNKYEIRGDVTAIIINSPKYGRIEAIINTDDLEKAQIFPNSWYVYQCSDTQNYYCRGKMRESGKISITLLHRWITEAPKDKYVDHINHDTLDNRRENLRFVTNSENQQNRKGAQTNSTTGVRGVSWINSRKKWYARIRINGTCKYIGIFEALEDAEAAVTEARMRLMPFSNMDQS